MFLLGICQQSPGDQRLDGEEIGERWSQLMGFKAGEYLIKVGIHRVKNTHVRPD